MSPVLHHDLFSCPCWFCSPSRPSITKIFTRREREGLTTSRQLVVLLVLTTWRTLYELVSSTWRTLEFLLLHEDLGDHSSIQVERDWDDMLTQPCLLLSLRFTEKLPYYITTTGTTWAQLCPDSNILPCVPCAHYLYALSYYQLAYYAPSLMLYCVTAVYLNCCYRNDITLHYDSCNCQRLMLK